MVKSTELSWELSCLDISCRIKRCFFFPPNCQELSSRNLYFSVAHGPGLPESQYIHYAKWPMACWGSVSYTEEAEDPDTRAGLMELWETLHSSNDEISRLHFTFKRSRVFFKNPVNARSSFHTHILTILIILRVSLASTWGDGSKSGVEI